LRHLRLLSVSIAILILSQVLVAVLPSFRTLRSFLLVSGLLVLLAWLLFNVHEIGRLLLRRSTKQWINVTIIAFLVLGIAVTIEILSFAYNVRFDLTPEKRFSLSEQTKKLLKSISRPVAVTAFFRGGSEQRGQMLDTFRLYQDEKSDFQFELLDLDRHPGRANEAGVSNYGEAVVEYRGQKTKIPYPAEDLLTQGILRVLSDKKRVLLFLSAHGEKQIHSDTGNKEGYSLIRTALERENYEVREAPVLAKGVPEDVSALIIAGPKTDLLAQELESVKNYLEQGGSVFFLLDPIPLPRITEFLRRYHILPKDEIVIDQENRLLGGEALTALVPFYKLHPITERFNIAAHFSSARPVEVKEKVEGVTELARSAEESWSTADLKGAYGQNPVFRKQRDRAGPVPVAAVATVAQKARLAVFGDSDFASNLMVEIPGGNKDLFLNTVEWLAGARELISVRPKRPPTLISPLTFTKAQSRGMIIALGLEGLAVAGAGLIVAIRKRKKM
jgi:ABC-type uncharacterized transport system involved in gliding motility auxiliary subunit